VSCDIGTVMLSPMIRMGLPFSYFMPVIRPAVYVLTDWNWPPSVATSNLNVYFPAGSGRIGEEITEFEGLLAGLRDGYVGGADDLALAVGHGDPSGARAGAGVHDERAVAVAIDEGWCCPA
jgi:hypothetical protein